MSIINTCMTCWTTFVVRKSDIVRGWALLFHNMLSLKSTNFFLIQAVYIRFSYTLQIWLMHWVNKNIIKDNLYIYLWLYTLLSYIRNYLTYIFMLVYWRNLFLDKTKFPYAFSHFTKFLFFIFHFMAQKNTYSLHS